MQERLMGVETEYAFAALASNGSPLDREPILTRLEEIAAHQLPHLPAMRSRGIFLANGARFYRDYGGNDAHQELATPECANPWDVVRYIRAGERMLSQLAAELLRADRTIAEALYFRTNVDYSGGAATWGCHESYLTRTDIKSLSRPLIPHLVSRIIYTGAGGFNARSPGLEFMLSPRVAFLCEVVSPFSESGRPIFHLKDESLAGRKSYHRLHVICGESLCSEMAIWLKVAATTLIVAMADAGLDVAAGVELLAPLEAMRQFASDPTCQAQAKSADGRPLSALAIQRHYLQHAEAHSGADFMPPWAGLACQQWRAILERLEQGAPDTVATMLDWAIKLAVFKDRVRRRGIKWDALPRHAPGREGQALRAELFEVDTRFGQFDTGIFTALDRAGVLHHHAPGVENIEHAMDNPPAVGRARVRGELIKRFGGCNGRYTCDWHGVWDLGAKRFLDLSDPFGTTQKWGPMPAEQETQHLDFQARMRERAQALGSCPANRDLAKVLAFYEQGYFEKAFRLLQSVERQLPGLSAGQRESYWRRKAWVQCRRGFLDARDCLQEIGRNRAPTMTDIEDYLCVLRFQGLAPAAEMNDWIRCGLDSAQRLESNPLPPGFHEHRGNLLLSTGQAAEAERLLELAVASYGRQTEPRLLARSLAALADAKRILGQDAEAVRLLDQAEQIQETHRFLADLAGFTRANRAKLIAQTGRDLERARTVLKRAKISQALRTDRLGLARTLLLEARLPGRPALAERRREALLKLKSQLPALEGCSLLAKILARWDEWTSHPTVAEHGDIFWGL